MERFIFNVIIWDVNQHKFTPYNIMPYLMHVYNELDDKDKPSILTIDDIKKFIQKESMYRWWSRCEYEILLSDWPNQSKTFKWDVYGQIIMNLDVVCKIFNEWLLSVK